MSCVVVNIRDDGWFRSGCDVVPADKMLCVVMHALGDRTPKIYQYREADYLHRDSDYFLDVSEKWELDSVECGEEWNPGFLQMSAIDSWKPLGLPDKENKRIIDNIEEWFD